MTKTKTTQLRKLSPKGMYEGKREIELAFACEREFFFQQRAGRAGMICERRKPGRPGKREKETAICFSVRRALASCYFPPNCLTFIFAL